MISPVRKPAVRAADTASSIACSGARPPNSRSIRPGGIDAEHLAEVVLELLVGDGAALERAEQSQRLAVAAEQLAGRCPRSRFSLSQKRSKLSQMFVVRTPPKSTSSPCSSRSAIADSYQPVTANRLHAVAEASENTEGIDVERVGAWLEANVAGAAGPFTYERIAGGRSNLTYRVTDSGGRKLGAAAPAAGQGARIGARHGPRAPGRLRIGADAGPGRPDRRLLHRRGRQRRALLRNGVRRGPDPAPP